jgi:hypothetical protein
MSLFPGVTGGNASILRLSPVCKRKYPNTSRSGDARPEWGVADAAATGSVNRVGPI